MCLALNIYQGVERRSQAKQAGADMEKSDLPHMRTLSSKRVHKKTRGFDVLVIEPQLLRLVNTAAI
jgi:hypothetical protein